MAPHSKEYMRAYYLANKEKWAYDKEKAAARRADPIKGPRILATNRRSQQRNRVQRLKDTREWRKRNAEHVAEYNKQWHEANNGKALDLNRAWRRDNREKRNGQLRDRYYSDILFRVEITLRNRLKSAIIRRLQKPHDSPPTERLIGCTLDQFIVWIEQHFTEGMTWSNYGKWHIDHARPCCSFDLTDPTQQLECFHYTNLQPLWAIDNCQKSSFWGGFRHHRSHKAAYERRAISRAMPTPDPQIPLEPKL